VQKTYQIVGEDEIEAGKNSISWKSPMAKALLGKSEGDSVEVKRPAGEVSLEIVAVQYLAN
jgi:transcription elongation GreA/GreB family factor